jgi:hypothetical protein
VKPLKPEHVWWHDGFLPGDGCGVLLVSDERPMTCRCGSEGPWSDFGWRVGNHSGDHSYYSTFENAARDRRCK